MPKGGGGDAAVRKGYMLLEPTNPLDMSILQKLRDSTTSETLSDRALAYAAILEPYTGVHHQARPSEPVPSTPVPVPGIPVSGSDQITSVDQKSEMADQRPINQKERGETCLLQRDQVSQMCDAIPARLRSKARGILIPMIDKLPIHVPSMQLKCANISLADALRLAVMPRVQCSPHVRNSYDTFAHCAISYGVPSLLLLKNEITDRGTTTGLVKRWIK